MGVPITPVRHRDVATRPGVGVRAAYRDAGQGVAGMRLYEFSGAETDWVAASSEAEARDTLRRHYGIVDEDIVGSYESISEVDASGVEFYTDEWDDEAEETVMTTAADMMAGKTKPFIVGSTAQQ